jgi:hypothetical protein
VRRGEAVSRIFLSHSIRTIRPAIALRDWLGAEGWSELFLDPDPQRGIAAGGTGAQRGSKPLRGGAIVGASMQRTRRATVRIVLLTTTLVATGYVRAE